MTPTRTDPCSTSVTSNGPRRRHEGIDHSRGTRFQGHRNPQAPSPDLEFVIRSMRQYSCRQRLVESRLSSSRLSSSRLCETARTPRSAAAPKGQITNSSANRGYIWWVRWQPCSLPWPLLTRSRWPQEPDRRLWGFLLLVSFRLWYSVTGIGYLITSVSFILATFKASVVHLSKNHNIKDKYSGNEIWSSSIFVNNSHVALYAFAVLKARNHVRTDHL